jgi:hypothetical protein
LTGFGDGARGDLCAGSGLSIGFTLVWKDLPWREGHDIEQDQIDQRYDHQQTQNGREACFAEYLPVRKDNDKGDQDEKQRDGYGVVVGHGEGSFGQMEVISIHKCRSIRQRYDESPAFKRAVSSLPYELRWSR